MYGVYKSTHLAIQGLLCCLDLVPYNQVILTGHRLNLLLQVCILEEYCIVLAQVGIPQHMGRSSGGLYNNIDWHDL